MLATKSPEEWVDQAARSQRPTSNAAHASNARDLLSYFFSSAFKSLSNLSNAFWYESWSFQLLKSPMWRVRLSVAAHAFLLLITASSIRNGNSTGFFLERLYQPLITRGQKLSISKRPALRKIAIHLNHVDFWSCNWGHYNNRIKERLFSVFTY